MSLQQILYYAKFDLRQLSCGGSRYLYTELESKVRKARKLAKQKGIKY